MTNGTETESGCDRRRYLSRDSRNDEWMERETEIRQDLAQPYPYPATQCLECCAAPEEAVAAGPAYLLSSEAHLPLASHDSSVLAVCLRVRQ
jgi:hypothetical protein